MNVKIMFGTILKLTASQDALTGRHQKAETMEDLKDVKTGLFRVKEEGSQDCSLGFPSGFALEKSLRVALPALEKTRPSLIFYLD